MPPELALLRLGCILLELHGGLLRLLRGSMQFKLLVELSGLVEQSIHHDEFELVELHLNPVLVCDRSARSSSRRLPGFATWAL